MSKLSGRFRGGSSAVVAVIFVAALVASTGADAAALFRETSTTLELENSWVRYVLSKPHRGAVVGLVDRTSGVDFTAGLPYPEALFRITKVSACSTTEIASVDPAAFSYGGERLADGVRLTLDYRRLGGFALDVTAIVTLGDDDAQARWRLVMNNQDIVVTPRTVSFPRVALAGGIGAGGEDDTLALPGLDGILIHRPRTSLVKLGGGTSSTWPFDLALQMAALYDSTVGLYVAVEDTSGRTKSLGFAAIEVGGVPGLLIAVEHAVPERPGEDFQPGYPVVLGPFAGDWYDAARLYRRWALDQPSAPAPLHARGDVPGWWRAAHPVLSSVSYGDDGTAILPATAMPAWAGEWSAALLRPVTLLTWGWEKHGPWTGPDYWPPRAGYEAFGAATAGLAAEGNHAYVYVSGTTWRLQRAGIPGYDDTARFEQEGRPWAARTCDGQPTMDGFYSAIGWPTVRMCPATEYWQQTVANNVATAAALGVDAVSVDEFPIGAGYACYSDAHGHPPGRGGWQGAAFRMLLARARSEGRAANGDLVITCEEPNELYFDLLDGYVSRDNQPDGFYGSTLRALGDDFETAPLVAATYHDRVLALAEPTIVYDAYGGAIDVVRTSLTRGVVTAVTRGKLPSAAITEVAGADPQLLRVLGRVSRLESGFGHEFAILGDLLRPPDLDVPRLSFPWVYYDLVDGGFEVLTQTAPAVIGGAFRSPAGATAVFLANLDSGERTVEIPLPAPTSAPPYLVWSVIDDAYRPIVEADLIPVAVEILLPGYGVGMVAAVSRSAAPPTGGQPRLRGRRGGG